MSYTRKCTFLSLKSVLNCDRNFAGVVLAADEGKNIASALGSKRAALLGNHGLLTVGKSIEETVAMFVLLEKCCEIQLAADASAGGSGKPLVLIGDIEAKATWEAIGTSASGYCEWYHQKT
jgi:ribulose-5-phosphate 4-epimerase/fuculose-1-phosphate aldolase